MTSSTIGPNISGGKSLARRAGARRSRGQWQPASSLSSRLHVPITKAEFEAVEQIARSRPPALRQFDQIAMQTKDLVRQAKLIAPYVAGRKVAFVGDIDSTSLALGALARFGNDAPAKMLVVDFDARLLVTVNQTARQLGFADRVETRLYNVFDAPPADLIGKYDWFYTNPPYGAYNTGSSAPLFIARGQELCGSLASGCLILPYDRKRAWTVDAWSATERFLVNGGWSVREKIDHLHRYDLDDDPELASAVILVDATASAADEIGRPYHGRPVDSNEIPRFYGRTVLPPYPRYIREDGSFDMSWEGESIT